MCVCVCVHACVRAYVYVWMSESLGGKYFQEYSGVSPLWMPWHRITLIIIQLFQCSQDECMCTLYTVIPKIMLYYILHNAPAYFPLSALISMMSAVDFHSS